MGGFCGACGLKLDIECKYCPECGAVVGGRRDAAMEPTLYLSVEPTIVDQTVLRVKPDLQANLGNESRGALMLMTTLFMALLWQNFIIGLAVSPLLSVFTIAIVSEIEHKRLRKRLNEEDKLLPEKNDMQQYVIRGRISD